MFNKATKFNSQICNWNLDGKVITEMFTGSLCSVLSCITCPQSPCVSKEEYKAMKEKYKATNEKKKKYQKKFKDLKNKFVPVTTTSPTVVSDPV